MASPKNNPSKQPQPLGVCSSELISPIQFFCRIRTSKTKNLVSKVSQISSTILSIATSTDHPPKSPSVQFVFDNIYTTSTNQEEFCKQTVLPLLEDLLDGDNRNPGVLPWCIDSLFNTLENHQLKKCLIVPTKANEFKVCSEKAAARARQLEHKKKSKTSRVKTRETPTIYINKGVYIREIDSCSNYAVFVSYIQIYKNIVYDLLDATNSTNSRGKKLKEDSKGKFYIEDIVEVEVRTSSEVYSLIGIGEQCKIRYQSLLSKEFSRGHSAFNIRTVHAKQGKVNKENLKVGHLSLVDLSGWNRFASEDDREMRLDEILCLQRCMQSLKDSCGKNRRDPVLSGDYALMSFFRSHFVGDSKIHVISCIDPHVQETGDIFESMRLSDFRPFDIHKYPEHSQIKRVQCGIDCLSSERRPSPIVEYNFENVDASSEVARKMIEFLDCKYGNASLNNTRFNFLKALLRQRLVDIRRDNIKMGRKNRGLRMTKKHAQIEHEKPTCDIAEVDDSDGANFCAMPCSRGMSVTLHQLDEGANVNIECQSNNFNTDTKYKNATTQTMIEDARIDNPAVIREGTQKPFKIVSSEPLIIRTVQVVVLKSKL